ncbi:transposase [Zooshikella ganghwensis]|uniref:Transposase DDE domain-containing protein n=1 Tax=Zooshikella ganghwensis TaxID=202772 RepID=A0A4V1INN8_9GAMM|nr:hypothetical protein B9G39_13560 [Zooshikella ganghwensis]
MDFWLSDDIETWWTHSDRVYDGTGSSQHYTDQAILTCHEIRVIFSPPLRQLEGFVVLNHGNPSKMPSLFPIIETFSLAQHPFPSL